MRIAILGADGFLGKALCKQFPDAVRITRGNFHALRGIQFDVFINANGNSRKWWAEKYPFFDYQQSTSSVYKTFKDFNIKHYIYISSSDVYNADESHYGFHKKLAEEIVMRNAESYLILRCSAMIGEGLKKGVVYDLMNGHSLRVSPYSAMQFIPTGEIAEIITTCLLNDYKNTTYNVGGIGALSIIGIAKMLNVKIIEQGCSFENHEVDVTDLQDIFPLKTSRQYVKEYIYERME